MHSADISFVPKPLINLQLSLTMEIMFTVLVEPHPVRTGNFVETRRNTHNFNAWVFDFGLHHFKKAI